MSPHRSPVEGVVLGGSPVREWQQEGVWFRLPSSPPSTAVVAGMDNNNVHNDHNNNTEEVDLRSIEAENVGDDDELDADLEREFLQQQEAKRLWEEEDRRSVGFPPPAGQAMATMVTRTGADEDADDPTNNNREAGQPDSPFSLVPRKAGEERLLTLCGVRLEDSREQKQNNKQNKLRELLLERESLRNSLSSDLGLRRDTPAAATGSRSPSVWKDTRLALFPEVVAGPQTTTTPRMSNGGGGDRGMGHDEGARDESHDDDDDDEMFQVSVPTRAAAEEAPSGSWLRLGLPSNSIKCTSSAENHHRRSNSSYQCRNVMISGASSKISVRTATSLERQYSTGSTSTVESPILLVQERKRNNGSRSSTLEPHSSGGGGGGGGGGRLTFSFPGWDVDISKGEKQPSVVTYNNHSDSNVSELSGRPPKRLRGSLNPTPSNTSRGKAVEEDLGDRSPVLELPDEILLQVMRRLNVQDLCSSVQTCKRCYAVGLQNDLWEHFLEGVDRGILSDSSSDCLPRWVCKKNMSLSETVRLRFNVFSKGYDYLRRALHAWWNKGLLSSRYSTKAIYSLLRKLTMNDWSLLYEALGVVFIDRTDRIASTFLRKLKPAALSTGGTASEPSLAEKRDSGVDIGSFAVLYEKPKSNYVLNGSGSEFEVHWKSGSIKEVSQEEGVVGKELWESLLVLWQKYKAWLHLISTHCPDLNREVNIERARSPNQPATPTVYNKGLICFRSQVVLRYGLRNLLQAGFVYLTTQVARYSSSDQDMDLLRASHHVLQELDVADDITLPAKSHTRTKLRQCFRSALSTNSKLALHMNDPLNRL